MSENSIATETQEIFPVVTNVTTAPVSPKKFPILITILILLLGALSIFTMYLFLEVRTLTLDKTTPSPSPSPIASPDPTSGWHIYENPKLGFSFKYPLNYQVIEKVPGYFRIFQVDDTDNPQAGIFIDSRLQKPYHNYQDATVSLFKNFIQSDIKSITDQTDPSVGQQIVWTSFHGVGKEGKLKGATFRVAYKQYNTGVIELETLSDSAYSEYFDQIISTFKFIDIDSESKFICPTNGWQNCMPILSKEGQKACSEEAMAWYKANCPDFKGAAL